MNSHLRSGVLLGLAFAFFMVYGGFGAVMWAVLFVAIGAIIGAHLDGTIDLRHLWESVGRGRRG